MRGDENLATVLQNSPIMRETAPPNASNPADPAAAGLPGASTPDRRRIDSDVRAFLREPSTPWIVFDQDARPASQLAASELMPWRCPLSSVMPEHGFFPATAAIDAQHVTALEPSSLAVASDLVDEAPAAHADLGSDPIPMRRLSRRVLGAAVGGAAMLAVVAIGLMALSATPAPEGAPAAAANAGPSGGDLLPPDLDVKAAPPPAAPPVVAAIAPENRPLAQRFGRLSIVGDARGRDVFLDGKRMLGKGTRSFTVTCGPHAIAIGNRADAREMDVPCNAELTLGK